MIGITARAARQVDALRRHYRGLQRSEAIRNLDAALEEAARRIMDDSVARLPAPRPYPTLARRGQAWVKAGPYWIRYRTIAPPVITAVFYDRANILGRA